MADVYNYIALTGVITTDTGEINTEVQNEYKSIFGQDLNTSPNTPQGMLITAETLSRVALADNNAALANQINPNLSGGIFLDSLLALLGSQRTTATYSTTVCTLTGVENTVIPAGVQISDSNGDIFQSIVQVTIPTGGTLTGVAFQAVNTGSIAAPANTLTSIISNILGWETVTNTSDAVIGTSTQTDSSARLYRQNTLAAAGMGLAQAITSVLYAVPGVTSLIFQENVTSTTQVINGISMVSHSLYTCVGGSAFNLNIATALTNKKSGGCAYNNGLGIPVSQVVTNQYSGQAITVLFDTPSLVAIDIIVTVHAFTSVANVVASVQNAILQYAAGGITNESGFPVGGAVSPFQLAGAINILVPGLFVQEVQVAKKSFTQYGTTTISTNVLSNLTYNSDILVGMIVTGAGIPGGTTVSSLSGGNAVVLSANATISGSGVFTFSFSPSYQTTEIPIQVWQQAVTDTSSITVNVV